MKTERPDRSRPGLTEDASNAERLAYDRQLPPVTWAKARIVPTRNGVVALPIPEPELAGDCGVEHGECQTCGSHIEPNDTGRCYRCEPEETR